MPLATVLLALATLGVPPSGSAPPAPVIGARLELVFDDPAAPRRGSGQALPRAVARLALAEAARIWAPYGVAVGPALSLSNGPRDQVSTHATLLTVRIGARERSRQDLPHASAFGSIRFNDEGAPERIVVLFYDDIIRLLSATPVAGRSHADWPVVLRDQVLGRVVGRVLAHEIGHFLLRTPSHSPSGLMRAWHATADFAGVGDEPFRLSKADRGRWRAVAAAAADGFAVRGGSHR